MYDTKKLSDNEIYVSGVLNELEITEGKSSAGKDYVRGTASIRVDQEIDGKVVENIIPVKLFSMRKKSDGTDNKLYDKIVAYKDQFTSVAAAEDESKASRVTIRGARVEENAWFDQKNNIVRSTFQISANFLNTARNDDPEKATFELSGVVGKMRPELDRDGNETGRTIVDFIVITWGGKANKIELIAQGSAAEFISANWQPQDTVKVTGRINMSHKTETIKEEQGFGEPIIRTRTVSKKELIITGGSPSGLEEALSYDADSIKNALTERAEAHKALAENPSTTKASNKNKPVDFGF